MRIPEEIFAEWIQSNSLTRILVRMSNKGLEHMALVTTGFRNKTVAKMVTDVIQSIVKARGYELTKLRYEEVA